MSNRRKRKPVRSKYTRLIESDSEDDDFVPETKKNLKIIKTISKTAARGSSLQETAVRISPGNNSSEGEKSFTNKNDLSLLDTSLIIENNSFSNDLHGDSEGEESIEEGKDEVDSTHVHVNDHPQKQQCCITINVESSLTDKDNFSDKQVKPLLPKENVQPSKPHPLAPPPTNWIPPGPASSNGCALPRPSYNNKLMGPSIRVGLSRKAAIKPLHTSVLVKK